MLRLSKDLTPIVLTRALNILLCLCCSFILLLSIAADSRKSIGRSSLYIFYLFSIKELETIPFLNVASCLQCFLLFFTSMNLTSDHFEQKSCNFYINTISLVCLSFSCYK